MTLNSSTMPPTTAAAGAVIKVYRPQFAPEDFPPTASAVGFQPSHRSALCKPGSASKHQRLPAARCAQAVHCCAEATALLINGNQ
jgi:hypothetical protein